MKKILVLIVFVLAVTASHAQKSFLQSGPMLGYCEMKEVMLWVQTNAAAEVHFVYWEQDNPEIAFSTEVVKTEKKYAFTAHCIADEVSPGKRYDYDLYINGQKISFDYPTTFQSQTLWQYRTDPPNFSVALGSCAYVNEPEVDRPGRPYGGNYEIYTSIHEKRPDVMLWLGDNTYLREVDFFTRTGVLHRNTHTRSLPEMQALLASTHNYAIWDDHDYGPNDSDRTYIHKDWTLEAFKLFWGNNGYGLDGKGITSMFKFNDIDFFLLDNRTFRTPNRKKEGEKILLGREQLDWLIESMIYSRAPFKMVCVGGQVLTTAELFENYINLHKEERDYLLRRIEEENITGVIFLTGDRHHTDLSMIENKAGNKVYDLTVSPLSSGAISLERLKDEKNDNLVEGTMVGQRNFGVLEFSGPRLERHLNIKIFDVNGDMLWEYDIDAPKRN
ncbi:MAG: alkaline phosphatase family protein [Bacteroidetes bacterium]|nr:MAG: alkaline phosphatase family protein [Bacteroidota bacterium]